MGIRTRSVIGMTLLARRGRAGSAAPWAQAKNRDGRVARTVLTRREGRQVEISVAVSSKSPA